MFAISILPLQKDREGSYVPYFIASVRYILTKDKFFIQWFIKKTNFAVEQYIFICLSHDSNVILKF
jgi:hypothetical protein